MFRRLLRSAAPLAAVLVLAAPLQAALPQPPATRTEAVADTLHGVAIPDPYRWLEDQDSPETRTWIDAQNGYTEAVLGPVPGREDLKSRIEQLLRIDNQGVPFERGGRYFYTHRGADQDLNLLCMRQGLNASQEVLIDPHVLSPDHSVSVGFSDVSEDGALMAYSTRKGGEDEVEIAFFDLATRKTLEDRLPRARYFGVSIKPDKSGFYYSRHGKEGSRVYYHAMGTDPARDRYVFGEGYDAGKIVGAGLSDDGRWLLISVNHGSAAEKSEIWMMDTTRPGNPYPIVNDVDALFSGAIADGRLYMRTNWNAPNYRLLVVDLDTPARDRWRELVPQGAAVITNFSLVGGKLFLNTLENVVSSVKIFDPTGKLEGEIVFPTLGSVGGMAGRWKTGEAFFTFTSFHVPTTIYRYDVAKGKKSEWWMAKVPVKPETFELKQVWYESRDGTRIPMFLVHRKGLKLDGSNPTLLTGYGGFTLSQTPAFSARAALWVERGGVFALANLRGGGEFGEVWHRAGMLEKKQNVFDDFHAAAEWLIRNEYTRPQKLAISGASNGGLLVGAAFTQRPELFGAVVCSVPLLDMLRYQQFLVARFWVPEYGAAEKADQFEYIHAYSPYHRVKKGEKYPAILFISGDADTRVAPLHARKMTALMQASTGSDRPILLHYDTKFGHSRGGLAVSKQIRDLALELQFLCWQLGVDRGNGRRTAVGSGE